MCSGGRAHTEVMLMAHAPPFCLLILLPLPITGWLHGFIGENEGHFLLLNKEKAGCEFFLLSIFKLPDKLPALPCPSPFISGVIVAGRAGARGIKSRVITKRAPAPGTHFPLLLPVMRPGPPLCLLFGAQICAPPLLPRPQRTGQQSPLQTSMCSTC